MALVTVAASAGKGSGSSATITILDNGFNNFVVAPISDLKEALHATYLKIKCLPNLKYDINIIEAAEKF